MSLHRAPPHCLHENGTPLHVWTARCPTQHLDCLNYARRFAGQWDTGTADVAAAFGHLNCLQYAVTHGAPIDTTRSTLKELAALIVRARRVNRATQVIAGSWRAYCATKKAASYIQRLYRDRLYRPGGQLAVAAGARFKEANNKDSGHKVKKVSNAVMFEA